MSASLVGSEMCIRDSLLPTQCPTPPIQWSNLIPIRCLVLSSHCSRSASPRDARLHDAHRQRSSRWES
eukprot:14959805-Alexandrium_andersonii.AAC.1